MSAGEVTPAYLAEHVRQAITTDGRTTEQGIDVRVVGDEVYLAGEVTSEQRRAAVAEVAAEAAGGRPIRNEVVVTAPTDRHTTERVT